MTAGTTRTPLVHINRRPLVPVCLAFLTGIAADRFCAWPLWSILVVLFVGIIAAWILIAARVRGVPPVAVVLLVVAFMGMARYAAFVSHGPKHVSNFPAGDAIVHIKGVVVEEPFAILRGAGKGTDRVEWGAAQAASGVPTDRDESGTDEPTDRAGSDEETPDPAASAASAGGAGDEGRASGAARTGYSTTFVVEVDSVCAAGTQAWRPAEGLVLVKFFGPELALPYGSRVKILGRLGLPPGPRNPGERDTRLLLELRGVHRQLVASKRIDIRTEPGSGGSLLVRLAVRLRHAMKAALARHMDPDQVPLAACMLLGMRESVTQEIEDNLQQTGTVHFLSVSGLHAWMIATLLWFLLRLLFVPRRLSAGILLLFILAYCLIAGARAPVVRSCIMAGAYFLAIILRKRTDGVNLLAFSALVILAARPTEMFEVGFQLSFVAVLCLLTLGRVLQDFCLALPFVKWALPQAGAGFVETP
ncbi:MAG: ComEC/Rec2 family competence protein, partial [Planctomycetota bacterium]|nr:ComEC/Rec2 family competence protein [Planctomycetota bacterium]